MKMIFMWLVLMATLFVLPAIVARKRQPPVWELVEREIAKHIRTINRAR